MPAPHPEPDRRMAADPPMGIAMPDNEKGASAATLDPFNHDPEPVSNTAAEPHAQGLATRWLVRRFQVPPHLAPLLASLANLGRTI